MNFLGKKKKNKSVDEEIDTEDQETKPAVVDLLGGVPKGPEQRSIMFVGEINEEKSADLVSALLVLAQEKEKAIATAKKVGEFGGDYAQQSGLFIQDVLDGKYD